MSAAREGPYQLPPPPAAASRRQPPHIASGFTSCPRATVSQPPTAAARSFNKHEDEFDSKQEYDDYLEEREDISERRALAALSAGQRWCRKGQLIAAVRCRWRTRQDQASAEAHLMCLPLTLLANSLQPRRGHRCG